MRRGALGAVDGLTEVAGDAVGVGLAVAAALGVASGRAVLIDSITAPWSGSETAARVPSFEMATGPSSGPSFSGNGFRTPASAFSQYQDPVPNARTANNPDPPGAAP